MAHKTKLFKKMFEANANEVLIKDADEIEPAMTEDAFIPLMGQMWDKAKSRYKKKYRIKYLEFAGWVKNNADYLPNKSIDELYEIWLNDE